MRAQAFRARRWACGAILTAPAELPVGESGQAFFFRIQYQRACDVFRLKRLEDRPEFEKGVDTVRRQRQRFAVLVADALPVLHNDPCDSLGHDAGEVVVGTFIIGFETLRGS
jgi:hypothetical protein